MKYCIYKGDIVEVRDISGCVLHIFHDGEITCVAKDAVIEISDDAFKEIELEFSEVKQELRNIIFRLNRLDEEYQKKKETLRELLINTRNKEISIVSRLITAAGSKDANDIILK